MKRMFRTQLDFTSILKISATLGFGSGLFFNIFVVMSAIQSSQTLEAIMAFFLTPIFSAFGGLVTGVLGFPFYYWYANKIQGQSIAGKFAEQGSVSNET